MKAWQKGLTIHNQTYCFKDLLLLSSDHIVSVNSHPWEKEIYRFIIDWLSNSDYIFQYSSGTTGKSKRIMLSKPSMMASSMNTCRYFDLQKGQSALLCTPVDFIAGKMMIVRSLVAELNLLLTAPKSVPEIDIHPSVDFCAMVPLQVTNLLTCRENLGPIKTLIIGGAEISGELEALVQKLPTRIYATYGMAETSSHIALRKLNGPDHRKDYQALPGVTLSTDKRGCLVIETNYLPSRVVTNDLVTFTGTDTFTWLGRYDNLINSGGIKIVPEEVEAMILSGMMLECTVIGLPEAKLGHKLVFVFEKDHTPDSFASLKTDFEDHLPRRWWPKEIVCVDRIPRNESWKVDRLKLVEMINRLF